MRGLAARAFTPKAIDAWRPRVVEMVDEILDTIAADGGCDLVSTLAFPLPFQVISELLGMPTDEREQLRTWSQAITLTLEPLITAEERQAATEASGHMREFVEAVIAERRKAPRENDLLSALDRGRGGGRTALHERARVDGAAALRRRPRDDGEPDRQRHAACSWSVPTCSHASEPIPPSMRPPSMSCLRMDGPVQFTARAVLERVDFGGDFVEKGAVVMPVLGAANHDPTHFVDPDALVIDRRTRRRTSRSARHPLLPRRVTRPARGAGGHRQVPAKVRDNRVHGRARVGASDLVARHGQDAAGRFVKPPPFTYVAPESLDEAVSALAEHGEDAKVLAGGQSLIPLLSLAPRPADARSSTSTGSTELSSIEVNGSTTIGAMTRHRAVERSGGRRVARARCSRRRSRTSATRHPDTRHDRRQPRPRRSGRRAARGRAGPRRHVRRLAASTATEPSLPRDFFAGYFTTALELDEMLSSIRFPHAPPGTGVSVQEMAQSPRRLRDGRGRGVGDEPATRS